MILNKKPFVRSIPIGELRQRLAELPKDRPIVAYCRGPYCLMAIDAVALLRKEDFKSAHLRCCGMGSGGKSPGIVLP